MSDSVFTDVSAEEFRELMQKEDVLVLDVRTKAEVEAVCIPGAITGMDYYNGEFSERYLELDRDKTYLVYCRSGVRSVYACEMMAAAGFSRLYNLRGGILAWISSGMQNEETRIR